VNSEQLQDPHQLDDLGTAMVLRGWVVRLDPMQDGHVSRSNSLRIESARLRRPRPGFAATCGNEMPAAKVGDGNPYVNDLGPGR